MTPPQPLHLQIIDHIDEIEASVWNALVTLSGGSVLCQHAFLKAFESSGSVAADTGWNPQHLLLWDTHGATTVDPITATLVAAVPLYAKGHSYGEFVFDWAWADAYQRHGLQYYPKWLAAVPFTPVPGPRLLTSDA
ncbi:MAG: N-acetyltransferase, partial [Alcaligenaceae bacterium]|nr:N-acetyltransferase [Alcaligenaceae bacterium]